MLYPRTTRLLKKNTLVPDNAMVSYKEHMTTHHRIMFLTGTMTGETESHNLLMAMDTLSHDPIKLVITSGGGELDSTFLFYDTMKMIKSPVDVVGRYCASAAVLLLAAGRKRYLFPHAKVMLHLPTGMMGGDPKDWDIQRAEMEKYQNYILQILWDCGVKKSREEILADIDRDFWLEPDQAIAYGLCDAVMTPEIWQEWTLE
jgi:ATP-dependent Clp protease protease subunit